MQFELEVEFAIDLDLLEVRYFSLQQRFHPDLASIAEIENSIAINESYKILKNPITRAAHILQLNNIDVEHDENAPKPDISTLEEVLEIQEKIPNLNIDEIIDLQNHLKQKIQFLLNEVAQSLDNKAFANAAQNLMKVKYFDKILRDLKNK